MDVDWPIRVLMLEDNNYDAESNERALADAGIAVECQRVESRAAFESAMESFAPDVVLLDYKLPGFDGSSALEIVRKRYCSTPAIIMTGALGDEAAIDFLKSGAADYVLKDRPARLGPAVKRALIDERKRRERIAAQRDLEANLILLKTQQECSPDGILIVDGSARVISQNQRLLEMWRVPENLRSTLDDTQLLKFVVEGVKDPEAFSARVAYLYAHPCEKSHEEIQTKDERTFDRFSSPMFDSHGNYLGRVWFFRDITEQRASEQKLRLFRTLVDNSNDTIEVIDPCTSKFVDVNERACIDLGYTRDELLSKTLNDIGISHSPSQTEEVNEQLRVTGKVVFEDVRLRRDGTTYPVEVSLSRTESGQPFTLAICRDITERKRAQKALQESETHFRTLIEDSSDPVAILEQDGTIRYTSPATRDMSGYNPEEIIGRNFGEFIHPDDAVAVAGQIVSILEDATGIRRVTARLHRKDGTWRTAEGILRNRLGVAPIGGLVVTLRDVTVRERSQRALAAMRATDAALVRASDEFTLAQQICSIMVRIGGYRMAWIGYPEMDEQKSIKVVAKAEEERGYLESARISWAESGQGCGPTGAAMRTGKIQVSRDYAAGIASVEQQIEAHKFGYQACVAIPLAGQSGAFGVITLYTNESAAFDEEEVRLLEQLSGDVSYGIQALRDRKQHALDLERLEQIMEATIHAIAATVERRDAYTAGHQRRVAMLSVAIACELGLKPERVRALELAAMIHDVGKIEIPAEILTKPRGLTDIEFSLVKLHPQAGYEILRNIDFPWPIAQMVWQHHELMDGSGYPRGLKGEEILLESRILTVADVVEAMSSHRPYRAGLGLDAALAEIANGRGTRFDPEVTNACLRLFREARFDFSDKAVTAARD